MSPFQITQLVVAVLGGSAVGALITTIATTMRNKPQPVNYRVESLPMFKGVEDGKAIQVKVSVLDNDKVFEFDNLHAIEVELINRGNQDRKNFTFGLNLKEGQRAVLMELAPPDRHHAFVKKPDISPQNSRSELDFTMEPFNRKDRYVLTIYVTVPAGDSEASIKSFSSPDSVEFREMPTVGEIVAEIAHGSSTTIGPLSLSVNLKRPWSKFLR